MHVVILKSAFNKNQNQHCYNVYTNNNVLINQLKQNKKKFFSSIIMLRFCKTKVVKEQIRISDDDVDTEVYSKLIETKTNSEYLIGYLHLITPLV